MEMKLLVICTLLITFTLQLNSARGQENKFEAQLNKILAHYPTRFDSLKGKKNKTKEEWESKLKLEGATHSLIEYNFGHPRFVAQFNIEDKPDSMGGYFDQFVKIMDSVRLSCCSFKRVELEDVGRWEIIQPLAGFENLRLDVTIVMMYGFKNDHKYGIQLSVGEREE